MLKNQSEEKKIYTMRRKKRNIRRIVALAAVLILVMAVGMTSIGGPERMLQFMKSSVGGRKVSQVDSSGKNKVIEEEDEELAYEDAEKEFGIGVVRILGKLDGMQFDKMILDRDLQVAELSYNYKDGKIQFIISAAYGETAWGSDNEDIVIDNYFIKRKETTIEVKKYKMPEKSKDRFAAEFEYKDLHYCITGTINEIEIKKILENLYFM